MTYDAAGFTDEMISVIREKVLDEDERFLPITDAVTELEKLLTMDGVHPDAAQHARMAIANLAAVWLDVDEMDEMDERALRWMS